MHSKMVEGWGHNKMAEGWGHSKMAEGSKASGVPHVRNLFPSQWVESETFHKTSISVLRQRLPSTNPRLPVTMKYLVMSALMTAQGLLLGSAVNVLSSVSVVL